MPGAQRPPRVSGLPGCPPRPEGGLCRRSPRRYQALPAPWPSSPLRAALASARFCTNSLVLLSNRGDHGIASPGSAPPASTPRPLRLCVPGPERPRPAEPGASSSVCGRGSRGGAAEKRGPGPTRSTPPRQGSGTGVKGCLGDFFLQIVIKRKAPGPHLCNATGEELFPLQLRKKAKSKKKKSSGGISPAEVS